MRQVRSDIALQTADLRAAAQTASAHLPALILSAQRLAAMVAPGAHGLRRAGPGEEFWQYRQATAAEAARNIDWRRSGRSDGQFVRERQAQTAQTVAIWTSTGQGMGYSGGPDRPAKRDRAQVLALALAMLLLRGGERVGILGRPARSGRMQADRMAEEMVMAGDAADDADAVSPGLLRPNQRLVILSDFLTDPEWVAAMLAQAGAMGVRGVLYQALDPDEEVFPWSGAVRFQSVTGRIRHDCRDAAGLRDAYLLRLAQRRDWLAAQARSAGFSFGHHRTDHAPTVALGWLYQVLEGGC